MSTIEARTLLNEVFEEQALALGGMAAIDELADEQVWQIVKHLDQIRVRTLERLQDQGTEEHPAIAHFLDKIRGAAGV